MALSRGVKIVLGCAVALVLVVGGVMVAIFGVAWWGINKAKQAVQQMEADNKRVEENLRLANANSFTEPTDGVIVEERLMRFLSVRKHIYGAYAKHKDLLEAQAKKTDPDATALLQLPGILLELRAAKAEGLAQQAMNEEEFRWLFGAVYRNMVVAGIGEQQGGQSVPDTVRSVSDASVAQAEAAAEAAEANPNVPEETKRQLREAVEQAREASANASEAMRTLDVPPANLALFKKHKDEILRYTMGGLELLSI